MNPAVYKKPRDAPRIPVPTPAQTERRALDDDGAMNQPAKRPRRLIDFLPTD